MFAINKWWRYCRYRYYFLTVVTIATISLPVEIIQPMLILLNYRSKHLQRQCYIYTFQINPLTHCDAVVDNVLLNLLFPMQRLLIFTLGELGIYQIHFTRLGFNNCSNVLKS